MSFLHLKFHSSRQKHTSQKWCLEVHTTFFKEVRAKKRLSIVWRAKNDVFLAKINNFCWNFKHFLEIQGRQIWWFWMKTNGYNMWWFWRFFYQKHVFSSKNIVFCIGNSLIKLRFIEDLNASKYRKNNEKIMCPCKIWIFWRCSKIFKTHPNRILNSGKNRYWVFYLFFKNVGNSINTILIYLKFSCHTCFFACLWNMEKMDFCWYLLKERS